MKDGNRWKNIKAKTIGDIEKKTIECASLEDKPVVVMNNSERDFEKGIDISKAELEKYALENYGVKPKTSFERMAVAQDKVFRTIHEEYIKTQKK